MTVFLTVERNSNPNPSLKDPETESVLAALLLSHSTGGPTVSTTVPQQQWRTQNLSAAGVAKLCPVISPFKDLSPRLQT